MHGGGHPIGWAGHMAAALALALVGGLVGFIVAGGAPFGRVIDPADVSAPTRSAPTAQQAPATPVKARLLAKPPFKAKPAAPKPRKRPATRRPKPREVVRVVATPVATPVPVAVAPAPPPAPPKKKRPAAAPEGGGWVAAEG